MTNKQFKKLVEKYVDAEIKRSWKGAIHPDEHEEIEINVKKVREKLTRQLMN